MMMDFMFNKMTVEKIQQNEDGNEVKQNDGGNYVQQNDCEKQFNKIMVEIMFNKMMGEKVQQNDGGKGSTKWWLKS